MASTELDKANQVFALIEELGRLLDDHERPDATNEFSGEDGILRYRRGKHGNWIFSGKTAPPPRDAFDTAPSQRRAGTRDRDIPFDINSFG
jgi:hypothetical protein